MLSFSPSASEYLDQLREFIAIPSVSRESDHEAMHRAASWLAAELSFAGGRVVETGGNPVVLAELAGPPGAATILIYGHYDVQPPGALEAWDSPPFELTVEGDLMVGRGTTDDKGPLYVALKVAEAFSRQEGRAPINVKFILEGEEEIGSPHFAEFVRSHAEELAADLVVSADGAMWRASEPSISTGCKGLVSLDLEVTGPDMDLHSGRFGGTVANPVHALSQLLASLHDERGGIAVEGFLDGVPELSPERRAELAQVPFDDEEYRRRLGVPELHGEPGYTTLERLWERPTLEVNGIEGGGSYTVIPHSARAHISCRLVPGQDPERVLGAISRHLQAQPRPGVRLEIRPEPGPVPAYSIAPDHPAVRAAVAALEEVYPGQPVLLAKIAGTLPCSFLFERELGAKTLFFSFSTADEKLHSPNEYMRIPRLREGMLAWERLWRLLGDGPHRLRPS